MFPPLPSTHRFPCRLGFDVFDVFDVFNVFEPFDAFDVFDVFPSTHRFPCRLGFGHGCFKWIVVVDVIFYRSSGLANRLGRGTIGLGGGRGGGAKEFVQVQLRRYRLLGFAWLSMGKKKVKKINNNSEN